MLVKISGELRYGNTSLAMELEVDVSGAVALIGPNLSGKSILLQCIFDKATRRIGRGVAKSLPCEVDGKGYTAVYVDAYRVVAQLYEAAVREELAELKERVDWLGKHAEEEEVVRSVSIMRNRLENLEKILLDLSYLLELKTLADDARISEAVGEFLDLYSLFEKRREEARGEIKELFDDFFPVFLTATREGFVWRDLRFRSEGRGLTQLSTGFSPALVALYAIYAYAIPQETYLLVEEPESHAHPVAAYFLGVFLRRLAKRSGNRLNVVAATHSLDFLRGFWEENFTKVYVLRRREARGKVELYVDREWSGEAYVPGFTDPAVYALLDVR